MAKGYWLMAALLVVLVSCEKKDPSVNPGDTPDPQWKITVDTTDMTSSMTAIIQVSFTQSEGTLAAFMGDDCCGIAKHLENLYWLYISPSATSNVVQLKFYSPELKRIFVAKETFPFVNDGHLGSVSAPYTPTWNVTQ
jgi:hypothetical protein